MLKYIIIAINFDKKLLIKKVNEMQTDQHKIKASTYIKPLKHI